MKTQILTIAIVFGFIGSNAYASEEIDILLGAAAGAAIGSTIGNGDGKKIATVVGGLIGANIARNREDYRYVGRRFEPQCKDRVPVEYRNNVGVSRSWVAGCIQRLEQRQAELEANAFEEGFNGFNP